MSVWTWANMTQPSLLSLDPVPGSSSSLNLQKGPQLCQAHITPETAVMPKARQIFNQTMHTSVKCTESQHGQEGYIDGTAASCPVTSGVL